jgi:hypothetical protein
MDRCNRSYYLSAFVSIIAILFSLIYLFFFFSYFFFKKKTRRKVRGKDVNA